MDRWTVDGDHWSYDDATGEVRCNGWIIGREAADVDTDDGDTLHDGARVHVPMVMQDAHTTTTGSAAALP
jgi:hypothetical protein